MRYVLLIGVLLAVGAGGYWLGTRNQPVATASAEHKILYYRNPMGLPDTSPTPKKDSMGMDYVPVYEGEPGSAASSSDIPGEVASTSSGQVKISVEKVQKLGVKTEQAAMRLLDNTVRAVGRVEVDERHIYNIAPKFEGWIEKLHVKTSGEPVKQGQPLLDIYSPELVSAQREYAIAMQGVAALKDADADTRQSMQRLADAALQRLRNWDISGPQVEDLASSGAARRSLTFHTPVNGIVLEKKAQQGMRFMPGDVLYQIADLSTVWVIADIFEQNIRLVRNGSKVQVKLDAYPDKLFNGEVSLVYPTLNAATRTVPVRIEVANPKGLLKPAMFASVEIPVGGNNKKLTVPTSAVIDSGTRQIVLVQLAQGSFEPRAVRLGDRGDQYVEVLEGIIEGEQVVTSANFLIDAESNLKAALGGMSNSPTPAIDAAAKPEHATVRQIKKSAKVGHQAQGTLDGINADGSVSISHQPIDALGWPAMTMDFELANASLAQGIPPGSAISFEIVERQPGVWVITRMQAKSHEGH